MENNYCRFCAEPKSSEKLLNLQNDDQKHEEIISKLSFLNAIYVNITNADSLPKTVCLICYDSLNKAYEFLEGVKRAQDILNTLITSAEEVKYEPSDDEGLSVFDELTIDNDSNDVKTEDKPISESDDVPVEVKSELKEEIDLIPNTLDVHDIIDAAFEVPLNTTVKIYAKELTDIDKRIVKNWRHYPWICSYCNIEFINLDMLRSHAKVVHFKCAAFFCIDCKVPVKVEFTSFIKHVRKHRKCLRRFCYYCDSHLDEMETLKTHIKHHFEKSQVPCRLCGEILNDEESLKIHLQEFASKPSRRPRRKRGTPITIEDLTCKLCKKVYKNPNSLRDHMKLHTIDRKRNYTCDRCGKMFYNKGTLTSHIMSHDKVRPHICRICNKSFLFPNMLRRHVEMHSGIKPFPCEQCGRCFRLQYQLNAHKIVHTDSMPYVCQHCNKAFRFKQILKNHERQHTGAKPYSCQHCGMEFTNWSNYNKHMKRRHGMDTSKKKITPEGVFPVNPETGQIMQVQDPAGTEEWKSRIMVPGKRGKKKKIVNEEGVL